MLSDPGARRPATSRRPSSRGWSARRPARRSSRRPRSTVAPASVAPLDALLDDGTAPATRARGAGEARGRRRRARRARRRPGRSRRSPSAAASTTRDPNPRIFPREDAWHDVVGRGVNVSWPLFDGGRARGETSPRRAALTRAAQERLAEFDATLAVEIRQRLRDLESSRAALDGGRPTPSAARDRGAPRRRRAIRRRRRDEHRRARRAGRAAAGRARSHAGASPTARLADARLARGRSADERHHRRAISRGASATSWPSTRDLRRRPGRGLRLSRQQRRRQVDDHPHAVRPADADERHGDGRRHRRRPRSRRREAPHRLHVAAVLAVRAADGRSEHPLLRRHLRPRPARGSRSAGGSCSRWPASQGRERTRAAISPAAGGSASRSAARSCTSRRSCFSTSRPAASIRCRAAQFWR